MENFHCFSITHKGAKHTDDEECQDASVHVDDLKNAAIAVVADGHGSSRCFRSDIGSKAAVDAAKNTIKFFLQNLHEMLLDPEDFRFELHGIVKQIINRWFAAVMKDEEANPLQDDPRLERITEKYRDRYINNVDYRCHAYGTTLMVAVMSECYWFGFQIGDGKCVVLYEDGTWKTPIPWDDRCSYNFTTSMCDDDSLSGFRYWFGIKENDGSYAEYGYGVDSQDRDYISNPRKTMTRPLAIFVASDGVDDSYPTVNNDNYVFNFYRNRVIGFAEDGFDYFKGDINDFAKRFADRESKDDVSIACILGDFGNKSSLIAKMKNESMLHDATEIATVKRRDANEKRDALNAVESRLKTFTTNQEQLEGKIAAYEKEVSDLVSKKKTHETNLTKVRDEANASDREMHEVTNKINKLENDRVPLLEKENVLSAGIKRATYNMRIAGKEMRKMNDCCILRQEMVDALEEKFSRKLASMNTTDSSSNDKIQDTSCSDRHNHTSGTVIGEVFEQVRQQVKQVFEPDLDKLEQELDIAEKNLKIAQSQEAKANQLFAKRHNELNLLQRQYADIKDSIRHVELEIEQTIKLYEKIELQNQKHRADVTQYQNTLTDIEKRLVSKQAEIDKLQLDMETLREQNIKQSETLAEIRDAWEKAEAEAVEAAANEAAIQKQIAN